MNSKFNLNIEKVDLGHTIRQRLARMDRLLLCGNQIAARLVKVPRQPLRVL